MPSEPSIGASCVRMVHSLIQEANLLMRQPLEVSSGPLKTYRQKLQVIKNLNVRTVAKNTPGKKIIYFLIIMPEQLVLFFLPPSVTEKKDVRGGCVISYSLA